MQRRAPADTDLASDLAVSCEKFPDDKGRKGVKRPGRIGESTIVYLRLIFL